MKLVKLKFRELELEKTDFLRNNLHIKVYYEEDKQAKELARVFNIEANVQSFVKNLITDIKNDCKDRNMKDSMDEYEFLSGIVNVVIEEHEDGFTELKMIDAIRRLKDKINFFKKVKSAQNYMSSYHDLNETRIRL